MVDEVKMGCVIQAAQGQNVARQASIKAGLPIEVPAITINVVCGSGLKCVNDAATMIMAGEADIVVAGGMENMSMAPYAMTKARFGYRMNNATIIDTMVNDALTDAFNQYHMGITAENVAEQWHLTREELDEISANSQQKATAAIEAGKFKDEIVPVEVKLKKKTVVVDTDEGPRPGTTAESISKLRPAFKKDGIVTAANSSGINDGAACVVVMSEEKAKELGVTRSIAAMRTFGKQLEGQIVAIGNAPTALYEVLRLALEEGIKPALIIGIPVGFVGAAESKDYLMEVSPVPYITVKGNKGGSPIAASVCNALLYTDVKRNDMLFVEGKESK